MSIYRAYLYLRLEMGLDLKTFVDIFESYVNL
jgi:hypothetical protein